MFSNREEGDNAVLASALSDVPVPGLLLLRLSLSLVPFSDNHNLEKLFKSSGKRENSFTISGQTALLLSNWDGH